MLKDLHEIVFEVTTHAEILSTLDTVKQQHLRDDLLSHCKCEIYRIAGKYPGKVELLYNSGQILLWLKGMIYRQINSSTSTFYRRQRKKDQLPSDFIVEQMQEEKTTDFIDQDLIPVNFNEKQKQALAVIYRRIESRTRSKQGRVPITTLGRMQKKLAEAEEVGLLLEAFASHEALCLEYIRKFYRTQVRFVDYCSGKGHAFVISELEQRVTTLKMEIAACHDRLTTREQLNLKRVQERQEKAAKKRKRP